MPGDEPTMSSGSTVRAELLFLMARFLSTTECKQAADVLLQELQTHELLPKGFDWEGNERTRSFDQLVRLNSHLRADYLLQICQRVGPLLDQLVPSSIRGIQSLMGAGSMSLLRTPESVKNNQWKLSDQVVLQNGCPRLRPKQYRQPSIVQGFHARQASGGGMRARIIPTSVYSQMTLHDIKLGHLVSVYCVTYDRTGQYIITGADDALVKIWHAESGRVVATLRGHAAEISDMDVNYENTLLATGSNDKMVRVWSMSTKACISVLQGHTNFIATVQFSPQCKGDTRILMSTGQDGCVCFWLWNAATNYFNPKPKKFVERSHAGAKQMGSSFSPGGTFAATASTDHVIRIYFLYTSEPTKICELEAHGDLVLSVCYSNSSNRFVSGAADGTARVWYYEKQEWRATVLSMNKINSDGTEVTPEEQKKSGHCFHVTMVCWNMDDSYIVTAVTDFTVRIWDANTFKLRHILKGHTEDMYVLDASPVDPRVVLSAGHDGNIILWDIVDGVKIKCFFNHLQGQGSGAVYDCKFTPDGQSFAATDTFGQLLFFGFGSNEKIKKVPSQVFFHTDYRPLIRDANNFVVDMQTEQPPHLMPPPFLVNIDGNPYPIELQRLVPGRENMRDNQLVPQLAINEAGDSEVIGDQDNQVGEAPAEEREAPQDNHQDHQQEAAGPAHAHPQDHDYSRRDGHHHGDDNREPENREDRAEENEEDAQHNQSIDELIRQLQQEQDARILAEGGEPPPAPPPPPAPDIAARNNRSRSLEGRVGMRRAGEVEGVRQSLDNMQQRPSSRDVTALSLRLLVKPLSPAELKASEARRMALAENEIRKFMLERKKKQSVPNTPSTLFGNMSRGKQQQTDAKKKDSSQQQAARNRLTTRALYDTEEEEVETEPSEHDSEDSSYSDWTMEGSSNLQPPKRRSQRKPKRRQVSSSEDDDEEEVEIEYDDDDDDDDDDDAGDDDNDIEYKVYSKRPKKKTEKAEEAKEAEKKKTPVVSKTQKTGKKPFKRKTPINKNNLPVITELKEEFMPPEWLTGTIPRKTPFVPQMGDEVMYFRQGHELYLQAVERHKSYEISSNICLPWQKNPHLREMELVKIVGIRYEVKPPRLCSLKLAYINPDTGKMSGGSFSIRYHDMPDVIDFLVLRQHFDTSYSRHWKPSDRFRSMIDDQWWLGTIESQSPLNSLFPDSMFQCFYVHWDNGEYERLSPWDMEPVNDHLLPTRVGGGVPVDPEELKGMLYTPKPNEWSSAGLEAETERILQGIEAVMEHSAAEPFNAPVDLNAFPLYAVIIEYPIDLSTIKARLENGYYRRINALQWDIRHIESNAKKFNEDGTPISRSAAMVTETLLKFISDPKCTDPMPILEQLSHGQDFSWGHRGEGDSGQGTSSGTSAKRRRGDDDSRGPRRDPNAWKKQCSDLLSLMMECEDAGPFLAPVDPVLYPEYYTIIETPMDLGTVVANIASDVYGSPLDFAKDVRLIFHNSKTFNTNKRSRIYSMTLRLSAVFEERVQKILSSWRTMAKTRSFGAISSRAQVASTTAENTRSSGSGIQSRSTAQASQPAESKPGPSEVSKSQTSARSLEDRSKNTVLSRRIASRPVKEESDDSDSSSESDEETEVEEQQEEGQEQEEADEEDGAEEDAADDDEDTEIEEEEEKVSAPQHKSRSSAPSGRSQGASAHELVSNGHTSYRTRAKTGSLRPKRYISSEEEEERDTRKNGKRAPSYSSRDSSFQHDGEENEDDVSTESSSDSGTSDSGSSTSKERKKLSKMVHRKRRKAAMKHRKKPKKRRRATSSEEEDSEDETEESDSDSDSEELPPRIKPRSRAVLDTNKSNSSKKLPGSGTRTTRNQGKRTCNYLEDSYDEHEEGHPCLSVSSRGRVRKMTRRARANRIDD